MSGCQSLFRVSSVGLLVTYWCNARCVHCYERAGPHRHGWISADAAVEHFASMRRLGIEERGIHIGGGEPFGNFAALAEILQAGRESGLSGFGYVETNGFWATEDESAIERLRALKDLGVRQISLSVDVYHQAYVDPSGPMRLARLAREVLGPRGLRVRRWRCLEVPQDLREATVAERQAAYLAAMARYPERMMGRAADELAPLLPGRPAAAYATQHCHKALLESGHAHVDLHGCVNPGTCAGLLLGRTEKDRGLDAVLNSPRGKIWQLLVLGGPAALADMASGMGFSERPQGYADKCHLCSDVRRWLFRRGEFPMELGPAQVYDE